MNIIVLPYDAIPFVCSSFNLYFLRFFLEISDPTLTLILTIEDNLSL